MSWQGNTSLRVYRSGSDQSCDLQCVWLTKHDQSPMYGADNRTVVGMRVSIRGRSTFASPEAWTKFRNSIVTPGVGSGGSAAVKYELKVRIGGVWTTIVSYLHDAPDLINGPRFEISATEATGTTHIACEWSIESIIPVTAWEDSLPVNSHMWEQVIAVGADGRLTRTIKGSIRCNPGVLTVNALPAPDATDWQDRKPWADLFRLAILPDVPGDGWRRTQQEFAYAPASDAVGYQVVDVQERTNLPFPARSGEMKFEYRTGYPNFGWADLTATVALRADLATTTRDLFAAAMTMLRVRADPRGNMMRSLVMREHNLTGEISIEVELGMRVLAANITKTATLPLAAMVGCPFSISRNACNRTVGPYGAFGHAFAMMPHWVGNDLSSSTPAGSGGDMPQPSLIVVSLADPCDVASVVTVVNDDASLEHINSYFSGAFQSGGVNPYPVQPDTAEGDSTMIHHAESVSWIQVDPRIACMSSAENDAPDWAFQFAKPKVEVRERVVVSRQSQSPAPIQRPLPPGAVVMMDDWKVTSAQGDAQGAAVFTGVFERAYRVRDGGGSGAGSNGFANTGLLGTVWREWNPPAGQIVAAYNPALAPPAQEADASAFGPMTDPRLASAASTSGPVA